MVRTDADLSPSEAAAFHEGLAHPARVAIARALRDAGEALPLAELRRRIAPHAARLDSRAMLFHVAKMERAGLVDVRREAGRVIVAPLRDASLKFRLVQGA